MRALLAFDRGEVLSFAPLGGETFLERVSADVRATLPDSLVLSTADGQLLFRSAAVVEGLRLAGGPGRILAAILRRVPTPLADRAYDLLAKARRAFFRPPGSACPAVAAGRRARLLP